MNTFDKLKIITSINNLLSWNIAHDIYNSSENNLPYHLYIKRDPAKRQLVIEFSGKILLDDYPQLINRNNIRSCFEHINDLGVCSLDINNILNNSKVVKADFTKDVRLSDMNGVEDMTQLKSLAKLSIQNYRRWIYQDYQNNGIVINNIVVNPRCRRRIIIYDKSHELRLARNTNFLNALRDPQRVVDYFNNRIRFELNATTLHQLRTWLNITDTNLHSVLNSDRNPLHTVISEIMRPINYVDDIEPFSLRDQDRLATLKIYEWELAGVEAHVREHSRRSVKDSMKRYKELYAIHHDIARPIDIREFVR